MASSAAPARLPRHPAERIGGLLSLVSALLWLGQAAFIAWALADLLEGSGARALWAVPGVFGIALLRAGLKYAADARLAVAADAVVSGLRARIVSGEAATTAPSVAGGPGAVAALACEKLDTLRPYLMRYRRARLRTSVLPLLILAIAFWHSWAVGVVLLMGGPLIPVFMALIGWAAQEASEKQMVEVGALNDLLVDRLAALPDMHLIGAGDRIVDSFAEASDSLRTRTMAVLRVAFLSSTVLELFSALGVAMVAVWVGFSLLGVIEWGAWGATLTPFAGIYLLLLAPEYFQPLRDLSAAWHDRAAGEAVLDELALWREEERPALMTSGTAPVRPATPLSIRLAGLVLRRDAREIAYPDLDIAAGDRIAITGPSGAGKTSLLRALAGLERAERGAIEVDGAPLDGTTADDWRARIGWMPQAPHFLNRSLRYNIGFGAPLGDDVLEAAGVAPVLETLPRGDLTPLGERGAGLSGGEARRVTLARALQAAPDLLLADEPTADLDDGTAAAVIDGLMRFAEAGGTLVVASHDPRLIARMDRRVEVPS
ncbi:thiol reductant ABC exporter subunit CydD [Chachezhania antarctica]|uniref:thiol reductant ABC exporter subunit CydD n=1 Tax=Chachezhania antarctica TaxID=2340860 RepID=UPI000EB03F1F|nr:thiol reductant ABC exporter subunit CydD [Chachezhania antarctica]